MSPSSDLNKSALSDKRTPPEWGKDLDWGHLPIFRETVGRPVTCNYGERHYVQVPACRSVVEESKMYGKRRLIQCEKAAGHEGAHACMTDICYWERWADERK